jgi:predicted nucleic acid-binding protein
VIVLDASVLIAYLDGEDDHHAAAEKLLADTIDDDLGANSLTLAEVLVVPVRTGRLEVARTALRGLEVQELPLPADTAVRLAQVRVSTA